MLLVGGVVLLGGVDVVGDVVVGGVVVVVLVGGAVVVVTGESGSDGFTGGQGHQQCGGRWPHSDGGRSPQPGHGHSGVVLVGVVVGAGGSGSGGVGSHGNKSRTVTGALSSADPSSAATGIVTSRTIQPPPGTGPAGSGESRPTGRGSSGHGNPGSAVTQTSLWKDLPGASSAAHRIRPGSKSHIGDSPVACTSGGSSATASARPVLVPVLRTSIAIRLHSQGRWPGVSWPSQSCSPPEFQEEVRTSTPSTGVGGWTTTGTVGSRSWISVPALMFAVISPLVADSSAWMR